MKIGSSLFFTVFFLMFLLSASGFLLSENRHMQQEIGYLRSKNQQLVQQNSALQQTYHAITQEHETCLQSNATLTQNLLQAEETSRHVNAKIAALQIRNQQLEETVITLQTNPLAPVQTSPGRLAALVPTFSFFNWSGLVIHQWLSFVLLILFVISILLAGFAYDRFWVQN